MFVLHYFMGLWDGLKEERKNAKGKGRKRNVMEKEMIGRNKVKERGVRKQYPLAWAW